MHNTLGLDSMHILTLLRCGSRVGSGITQAIQAMKAAIDVMATAGTFRNSRTDMLSSESNTVSESGEISAR